MLEALAGILAGGAVFLFVWDAKERRHKPHKGKTRHAVLTFHKVSRGHEVRVLFTRNP